LGLKLTKSQVKRLALIFDEDFSGLINFGEYQNCLEAYQLGTEEPINPRDPSRPYKNFETRTMAHFVAILEKNNLDAEGLWAMVDKDNNNIMSLTELKKTIQDEIDPNIQEKALHTIYRFMDSDGNGRVTKDEFLKCVRKAYKFKGEEDDGNFSEESLALGDESVPNTVPKKPYSSTKSGKGSQKDYSNYSFRKLIEELERIQGEEIQFFLIDALKSTVPTISMRVFARSCSKAPQNLIDEIFLQLDSEDDEVKVAALVRQICKIPGRAKDNREIYKNLASNIRKPIRATLERLMPNSKKGITKEMFQKICKGQGVTDWQVCSLFHQMSQYQGGVEVLDFKSTAKILCDMAGEKEGEGQHQQATTDDFGNVDARRAEHDKIKPQFTNMRIKQASQAPAIIQKYDVDPMKEGCLVTNQKVVKTMTCFYCLSNLFTKDFVHEMCSKLRLWIDEFENKG
jgi:hypothetical protein